MTSVYATSPTSPFGLNVHGTSPSGGPSSASALTMATTSSPSASSSAATVAAAARYMSTTSPRANRRSPSVTASSPLKDSLHSHHGTSAVVPPLNLPRGYDTSDVAALSASLDGNLSQSRSLREVMESPAFAAQISDYAKPAQLSASSTTPAVLEDEEPTGPFEGPEKLLELWFADSIHDVVDGGLMRVDRQVWENMLDIVRCKVLSVIRGNGVDAYLLSESSMFVFPHKLILKTCGTTTLLLGLHRILSIAHETLKPADEPTPADALSQHELGQTVKRCFYSRKSFMFPEHQKGPHRNWMLEVGLLEEFFPSGGSAYTVGKMNGDHWLLYMTAPNEHSACQTRVARPLQLPSHPLPGNTLPDDQTLEILMTHLSPASCSRFEFPSSVSTPLPSSLTHECAEHDRGHLLGSQLSAALGLTDLFDDTTIDGYAFEPCGFSANAIVGRTPSRLGEQGKCAQSTATEDGYWTVHVTPEQESSYASFETNMTTCSRGKGLPWLIARVLAIFEPGRLSVTLFTSSLRKEEEVKQQQQEGGNVELIDEDGLVSICPTPTQGDVLHMLQLKNYRRTDRIAYEFEDYDLVFVSFEKIGLEVPKAQR